MMLGPHLLSAAEWVAFTWHFMMLSLLAVGGAIATAPDMHRYLVVEHQWLTDAQFTSCIALAQAAPGPNVLFVPVLGFSVAGIPGMLATLVGTLLPSTTLALYATRWGGARRESRGVRTFVAGMAPVTLGLVLATGWILSEPSRHSAGAVALLVVTVLTLWRTRLSPIWMVAAGAVVGAFGWT